MPSDRVGVREIRRPHSRYLDRVKAGEELVITERGTEVARLAPAGRYADDRARLAEQRRLGPPGRTLEHLPQLPPVDGPSVASVLDELRAEHR